jgi:twitching motility protein PilT
MSNNPSPAPGTRLADYEFVDLFLGVDFAEFKGLKNSPNLIDSTPKVLEPALMELRSQCRFQFASERDPEFARTIDKVMYRITHMRDHNGNDLFILRRSTAELRPLEKVGIAPFFARQALDPKLSGLILVAGETGAGKTSTAVAFLVERMTRIGGIAVAIEDPPEVPLNGPLGKGRCMQIRASRRTGGYKEHLVRSLRANPNVIFLGEVREEAAAQAVLEASLNGHLIISTVHAGSVEEAIERLASLAANGDINSAYRKLSQGLKMVIWQDLEKVKTSTGFDYQYEYQALSLIGDQNSGARSRIHTGKVSNLANDIDMQMRQAKINPLGQVSPSAR